MRLFLVFVVSCSIVLAQTSTTLPTPQSARQALIEMFLGKGENTSRNIFRRLRSNR